MTDSEPYLILHKVRGEPAFDIAHQIEMEGEECWIVGTIGHRAYPRAKWPLDLAIEDAAIFMLNNTKQADWDAWPDHYPAKSSPAESTLSAKSLLTSLGLPTTTHNAMVGKLTRRV